VTPDNVTVPFGKTDLQLELPAGWNLRAVAEPAPYPAVDDVAAACREALEKPIGAPPLHELARGKSKVVIVLEDVARPTPVHQFAEPVADALAQAGVPDEAVTVLTGLGIHRPMSEDEVKAKIGEPLFARYKWINHNADPGEHLAHLGRTERGTEVWLNRAVVEADLVIALGCVEPHIIASFGGGMKMILPGVAGRETVAANHAINTRPETFNNVGLDPDKNPMRQDLEEAAAMLDTPVFIVNAVLRGDLSIARFVAGDAIQAHREGCRTAAEIFGAPVPGKADVVITSSHPMDHDFRQGAKAVANTIRALKPGGTMLCLMACEQGVGDFGLPKRRILLGQRGIKAIAGMLLPLLGRWTFGMREEDHFLIYFTLQTLKNYRVLFYAPPLTPEMSDKMPFMGIRGDLDAMLAEAVARTPHGDVFVFPKGGVTYPVIQTDTP